MIILLSISGSRHGVKLKLSPKKLLDKKWPFVTPLPGSHDKCTFYRPENKFWTCVITKEVGMQWVLYLYQLIPNRSHNVKYTINADHVTNVFFSNFVFKLLKMIFPWYVRSQTRNVSKTFTREAPWKSWLLMITSVGSREKSSFYRPENKSRILKLVCRRIYSYVKWFLQRLEIFNAEGHKSFSRFFNMIIFHKKSYMLSTWFRYYVDFRDWSWYYFYTYFFDRNILIINHSEFCKQ